MFTKEMVRCSVSVINLFANTSTEKLKSYPIQSQDGFLSSLHQSMNMNILWLTPDSSSESAFLGEKRGWLFTCAEERHTDVTKVRNVKYYFSAAVNSDCSMVPVSA